MQMQVEAEVSSEEGPVKKIDGVFLETKTSDYSRE